MNKKELYNKIMESVAKQVMKAINEDVSITNAQGRPITTSKLSNLYPIVEKKTKNEEKYIRALIKSIIMKQNKIFYLDNLQDVGELRSIFFRGLCNFLERYKDDGFNREDAYNRYPIIYNFDDLNSFMEDLRQNYSKLCKNPNFPKNYIQLNTPAPTIKPRGRHDKDMTEEQKTIVNDYIKNFGKGTNLDEIQPEVLEQLRKYNLKDDGFVYVVCRPIREDSDSNAPSLVYKLVSKYSVELSNAIRLIYHYQCEYDYNCYVNYMYVSSIHLDKYLRNNYIL